MSCELLIAVIFVSILQISTSENATETPPTVTISSGTINVIAPKTLECTTPIEHNGQCIDLYQCASLMKLIMKTPLTEEIKLYLRLSQCGSWNKTVWVCCPDQQNDVTHLWNYQSKNRLPQPPVCGSMLEDHIFRGYTTNIDGHPWLALLEYSKGTNETKHFCSGTLISDRYILTAAHCVADVPEKWSLKSVRLGEWDVSTDRDCTREEFFHDCADPHRIVAIDKVIPHPNFSSQSYNHDVALIRLADKVNYTDFIRPICLPIDKDIRNSLLDNETLTVAGWGVNVDGFWSTVKQNTHATMISFDRCREMYANTKAKLKTSHFCLNFLKKNDTCLSDSGGPVIHSNQSKRFKGAYFITGIQFISPVPCDVQGLPVIYTNVSEYVDWILDNIQP